MLKPNFLVGVVVGGVLVALLILVVSQLDHRVGGKDSNPSKDDTFPRTALPTLMESIESNRMFLPNFRYEADKARGTDFAWGGQYYETDEAWCVQVWFSPAADADSNDVQGGNPTENYLLIRIGESWQALSIGPHAAQSPTWFVAGCPAPEASD